MPTHLFSISSSPSPINVCACRVGTHKTRTHTHTYGRDRGIFSERRYLIRGLVFLLHVVVLFFDRVALASLFARLPSAWRRLIARGGALAEVAHDGELDALLCGCYSEGVTCISRQQPRVQSGKVTAKGSVH